MRTITTDPIVNRIISSLQRSGKTASALIEYLGVGKNIIDTWKFTGSKSYMSYIDKIADFTGVSIDYLVRGEDMTVNTLTATELDLVKRYRNLSDKRREVVLDVLKGLEKLEE